MSLRDKTKLFFAEFPEKYGNTFKVYMMMVIELSLLAIAGFIIVTQMTQINRFRDVMAIREKDIMSLGRSARVRNLLLQEIADQVGVDPDRVRYLLEQDRFSQLANPDKTSHGLQK